MKIQNPIIVFFIAILIISCKKELPEAVNEIDNTAYPTPHEFPTDSGTYWVYETFIIDSIGNETSTGSIDTVRIIGDSTINGNEYIVYQGLGLNQWSLTFLRDSSGYIVYHTGQILYHTLPKADTIRFIDSPSNAFSWYYKMTATLVTKTVPYGSFDCFEHNSIAFYSNGEPVNVCGDQYYQSRSYYEPYLGMVARQFAYITEQEQWCQYREQRLIDYYHP